MVPERYWRHIGPATRERIAALANIAGDDWMQDWPLEASDPARVFEFVELLAAAESDEDRFALMQLVLYSVDLADPAIRQSAWPMISAQLERSPALHAQEIIYWSLGDETDDGVWVMEELSEHGGFAVTYLMRDVLIRVAADIGLRLARMPDKKMGDGPPSRCPGKRWRARMASRLARIFASLPTTRDAAAGGGARRRRRKYDQRRTMRASSTALVEE